jgi:hypothetical protein
MQSGAQPIVLLAGVVRGQDCAAFCSNVLDLYSRISKLGMILVPFRCMLCLSRVQPKKIGSDWIPHEPL